MNNLLKINKNRKRIGRGSGSGSGTTAGRGTKGQKSRSGGNIHPKFQGGLLPLWQKIPKKDGIKPTSIKPIILNLDDIETNYKDDEIVTLKNLEEKGLIKPQEYDKKGLKILASGKLTKKVKFDENILTSNKVKSSV